MPMSVAFCTIITRSHQHWALALHASLQRHQPGLHFVVLVTDADGLDLPAALRPQIEVLTLADVRDGGVGDAIQQKYAERSDALRWSLKPVLMRKLLERHEKVLYGDCDLYFFAPIGMLLDQLDRDRMLLAPHWRWSRPDRHTGEFIDLMTAGLFNGGFVAANREAMEPLEHWAHNCMVLCEVDPARGQFVDQSHLNVLPVYHEGIGIIRHRGCNVAFWNRRENVRSVDAEGTVRINGSDPIVFIHFTKSTVRSIATGEDPLLRPHLAAFNVDLGRFGGGYDHVRKVLEETFQQRLLDAAEERARHRPTLMQRVQFQLRRVFRGRKAPAHHGA